MKTSEENLFLFNGHNIKKYTLINDNKTKIEVLSWGGTLITFDVYNNNSKKSLVVSYDNIKDYINDNYKLCKSVGPVAGRIGNASYSIDNKYYKVTANENGNLLHSGFNGFSDINWTGVIKNNDKKSSIILSHHFNSFEDSFPGDTDVNIIYSLDQNDCLTISWNIFSNRTTLFNPTLHTYFNVNDHNNLNNQKLKIFSDYVLELSDNKIPTGSFLSVSNTPYDFRKGIYINDALNHLNEQTKKKTFDDAYLVDSDFNKPIAIISSDEDEIKIFSNRNGLILFIANPLDSKEQKLNHFNSVALEAQMLPDAINHSNFGNIILDSEQSFEGKIKYEYIRH